MLVWVVGGVADNHRSSSPTTVVGFRVDLDSVNNGTLVRAAAHILCGTVRVKQVDRICAARVSSEIW